MGDSFERFVIKNRQEFDTEMPNERLWDKIEVSTKKPWPNVVNLWKVAAVLLLVTTIGLLIERTGITQNDIVDSRMESTEFQQVEAYYTMLISAKHKEIINLNSSKRKNEFLKEIVELDNVYADLKILAKKQESESVLTDAMINNLQLRLEILNRQLEVLKRYKNEQIKENSDVEI